MVFTSKGQVEDFIRNGNTLENQMVNKIDLSGLTLDNASLIDLPGGTVMDGNLRTMKPITGLADPYFKENVEESIARSWYDGNWSKHPWESTTDPKYTDFIDEGRYSWMKAPRFQGKPMQVGPLAQMVVGYAQGHKLTVKSVNAVLDQFSSHC